MRLRFIALALLVFSLICMAAVANLPPPRNLVASPAGVDDTAGLLKASVSLEWAWAGPQVLDAAFLIQRRDQSGIWTDAGTVPAAPKPHRNLFHFFETSLAPGTPYWYRVAAASARELSNWSHDAAVVTEEWPATQPGLLATPIMLLPDAPTITALDSAGISRATGQPAITFRWRDGNADRCCYQVQRVRQDSREAKNFWIGAESENGSLADVEGMVGRAIYIYSVRTWTANSADPTPWRSELIAAPADGDTDVQIADLQFRCTWTAMPVYCFTWQLQGNVDYIIVRWSSNGGATWAGPWRLSPWGSSWGYGSGRECEWTTARTMIFSVSPYCQGLAGAEQRVTATIP